MLPGLGAGDTTPGRTQSLYRKHRPETFDENELVGQEHISRTLRNAISRGRVAHAYLFCGPRGTGKTTTARLLAKAVNCLDPDPEKRPCNACMACVAINESRATDIIEIDAASNRGIDDIRELRDQVRYAPTQLRTKFYIIDEAHQITRDAFNAFLKTLEEPPPNTTFVLATTDPDKLPETIASRCQRFDFHRIPRDRMIARVRSVSEREGITVDDDALEIIVRRATGSLRDALSLLDMLATAAGERSEGRVTAELVRHMLGISDDGWEYDLAQALADRDVAAGLKVIGQAVDAGQDMRAFGRRVLDVLRLLMLVRAGADPIEANERIRALAQRFELHDLLRINEHFSEIDFKIRTGGFPQLPLELALVASLVAPHAGRTAPAGNDTQRQTAPPPPAQPAPAARPRQPRSEPQSRATYPEPTPIRPPESRQVARPSPAPQPSPERRAGARPAAGDIDVFIAGWERVRTEVKAVDRKAEALLASTDPTRLDGDTLILVAAYPFHASKLNEPKVRGIVEDAIEQVTGRRVSATFLLREELSAMPPSEHAVREAAPTWESPATGPSARDATGTDETASSDEQQPPADRPAEPELTDAERAIRVAKAIFDAEEVDPDEVLPLR